jgi:hypothetical protein
MSLAYGWIFFLRAGLSCGMKLSHKKRILSGVESSSTLGLWNMDGMMIRIFVMCAHIVWTLNRTFLSAVQFTIGWSSKHVNGRAVLGNIRLFSFCVWMVKLLLNLKQGYNFRNQTVSSKGSPGSTVDLRGSYTGTVWKREQSRSIWLDQDLLLPG